MSSNLILELLVQITNDDGKDEKYKNLVETAIL